MRNAAVGIALIAVVLCACQASVRGTVQGNASAAGSAAGQGAGPPGAGQTPPANPCQGVRGNDQRVTLPEGTFSCDLVVTGNDNKVIGAGIGRTIVEGRLVLSGNDNEVHGLTVRGPSSVSGNDNGVEGNEFAGGVSVRGNDNRR